MANLQQSQIKGKKTAAAAPAAQKPFSWMRTEEQPAAAAPAPSALQQLLAPQASLLSSAAGAKQASAASAIKNLPRELQFLATAGLQEKQVGSTQNLANLTKELQGVHRGESIAEGLNKLGISALSDIKSAKVGGKDVFYNAKTNALLPDVIAKTGSNLFKLQSAEGGGVGFQNIRRHRGGGFGSWFREVAPMMAAFATGALYAGGALGGTAAAGGAGGGAGGGALGAAELGSIAGPATGTIIPAGAAGAATSYPLGAGIYEAAAGLGSIAGPATGTILPAGTSGAATSYPLGAGIYEGAGPTILGAQQSLVGPATGTIIPAGTEGAATSYPLGPGIYEGAGPTAVEGGFSLSDLTKAPTGGSNLLSDISKIAEPVGQIATLATLLGGAGSALGVGGGEAATPSTPALPASPAAPSPEEALSGITSSIVAGIRRRRGRASTILSKGAEVPYELFGNA